MPGVEDDAEKVEVEAFVLKKITRDLPLHSILVALMWDHLSDLKLADSDFRTPARNDLLLGLKYSRAYFAMAGGLDLDARHPHAVPTCFGWVLLVRLEEAMW